MSTIPVFDPATLSPLARRMFTEVKLWMVQRDITDQNSGKILDIRTAATLTHADGDIISVHDPVHLASVLKDDDIVARLLFAFPDIHVHIPGKIK